MESFKQKLYKNGYFRQEELVFWDCDREQRVRLAALLSRLGAFAGYDYDARGLTHEVLWANREVFLLSRASIKIQDCPHAGDVLDITTDVEVLERMLDKDGLGSGMTLGG